MNFCIADNSSISAANFGCLATTLKNDTKITKTGYHWLCLIDLCQRFPVPVFSVPVLGLLSLGSLFRFRFRVSDGVSFSPTRLNQQGFQETISLLSRNANKRKKTNDKLCPFEYQGENLLIMVTNLKSMFAQSCLN